MANTKPKGLSILLVVFLLCVCGLILGSYWAVEQITTRVNSLYGYPDANLSFAQESKLTLELYLNGDALLFTPQLSSDEIYFEVGPGESIYEIAEDLQVNGYIKNADSFINLLVYRGYDRRIQTGRFVITSGMNGLDIAQKLINPIPEKVVFIILPGWRAEEIAEALEYSGLSISKANFLSVVRNPPSTWLPPNFPATSSLEGYLAPGEYYVDRDITNAEFIQLLVNQFNQNLDNALQTTIQEKGLTISEAVILASIVEREAIVDDEMPMIASVFLNRHEIGMKLDSDPTVQYAVGYNPAQETWWTNPLSLKNLQIDSAFNTYLYKGLPPHPIANPSLKAIQAVAFSADTPYYYFRAKCDSSGRHEFARSYEEHLLNDCDQN